MCNTLNTFVNADNKTVKKRVVHPIPERGFGYRLVGILFDQSPIMRTPLKFDSDGWIRWDDRYKGDGFCLFLTEKEAKRAADAWNRKIYVKLFSRVKLIKVEYRGGLGIRREHRFVGGKHFNIALCKEWRYAKE